MLPLFVTQYFVVFVLLHPFAPALNVTVTLLPVQSAGTQLAVVVGAVLSYCHVNSLLAIVFLFHARSSNLFTAIFAVLVPFHVSLLFTVHTYTVFDTFAKLTILPFVIVRSLLSTHVTTSLNVHVTTYVAVFEHANAFVVNVTVGFVLSTTNTPLVFAASFLFHA